MRRFLLVSMMAFIVGCGGPPQLGTDEETFKTVDALFTAVTARQTKLVKDCDITLTQLHTSGKLPEAAWKDLRGVMDQSYSGKWESAAKELYDFMKGQRREGVIENSKPQKKSTKKN